MFKDTHSFFYIVIYWIVVVKFSLIIGYIYNHFSIFAVESIIQRPLQETNHDNITHFTLWNVQCIHGVIGKSMVPLWYSFLFDFKLLKQIGSIMKSMSQRMPPLYTG